MAKQCKKTTRDEQLQQIIGLGDRSVRKNYYPQLRENSERVKRFRTLLDYTTDWVILISLNKFRLSDVNQAACELFSLPSEAFLGATYDDIARNYPNQTISLILHRLRSVSSQNLADGVTLEMPLGDNDTAVTQWIEMSCRLAQFENSDFMTVVGRDITERKQHEQVLENLLNEKEALLDNALVGLAWVKERTIITCNRKLDEMVGLCEGSLAGQSTRILYESEKTFSDFGADAYKKMASGKTFTGTMKLARQDGSYLWCELTGNAITPQRPQEGSVWIFTDVHENILNQEKALFLTHYDPLTELPNHTLLEIRCDEAIHALKPDKQICALIYLDLDRFKHINDLLGYSASNQLLVAIAERLKRSIGQEMTLSRQGGDEFLILLPRLNNPEQCLKVLSHIHTALNNVFTIASVEVSVSCSMGVAIYPQDGQNFPQLLNRSEMAMYEAKQAGRNTHRFFSADINDSVQERFQITQALNKALELNQLQLHYQPQINLTTGELIGAECLLRWHHPQFGPIPPGKFIPLAEENGMIVSIGAWVLQQACLQINKLLEMGLANPLLAVNLSAVQFNTDDIVQTVQQALEQASVPAHMLELELTESLIMKDTEVVFQKVNTLKKMGCKLSIDDFGTGYSSLAYLKRFAVDKLKIDQAFVREMHNNQDDAVMVNTIIQMAKNLGLTTIAEGIECREALLMLQQYHCEEAQGYYIAKPMPEAEFRQFIMAYNPAEFCNTE